MTSIQKTAIISASIVAVAYLIITFFTASTNEHAQSEKQKEEFQSSYKVYALNMPDEVSFAGEKVPLNLLDVKEKLDRELHVNTYWQSQTMLFLKRSNRWFPVIEPILKEEGVPDDLKYLALIESGLQDVVSPAGATGFWQLMKAAAKENGLEVTGPIDERYHIEKSTRAACAYLKSAKEKFGTWTLAAASYNMGRAGLLRQLDRQKASNYYDLVLNSETSRYVFRIVAAKLILSNPKEYGFTYSEDDLYRELKYKEISVANSVDDLAKFAFENGINYKALKYLNPWLRENYLKVSEGKEYIIKIPTSPLASVLINDMEQVATFGRQKNEGEDEEQAPEE